MRKCGPAKELGYSRPDATWTYNNTYCCIVSLLSLAPLPDNFSQNLGPLSHIIFVRHIEYSTFKTFSLDNSELSATQVRRLLNRQSHFLPHLIDLNSTRQKCDVWTGPNPYVFLPKRPRCMTWGDVARWISCVVRKHRSNGRQRPLSWRWKGKRYLGRGRLG